MSSACWSKSSADDNSGNGSATAKPAHLRANLRPSPDFRQDAWCPSSALSTRALVLRSFELARWSGKRARGQHPELPCAVASAARTISGALPLIGIDPVHGIAVSDRLKLRQRRIDANRKVVSAARGNTNVFPEDRCPSGRRHGDEANGPAVTLADDGVTVRGFDVLHPIRVRAKHRYQVPHAPDCCDHDGCRARMAGDAP